MKPVETLYFSAGTNLNWKYMDNQYLGDVVSENGIRSLGIYGLHKSREVWDNSRKEHPV